MTILVLDGETTGLDPKLNRLLEIAFVVATDDLEVLGTYSSIWPQLTPVQQLFNASSDHVQRMHTDNGLWLEIYQEQAKPPIEHKLPAKITQEVIEFLAPFGLGPNAPVPAYGRNPGFDLAFLSENVPFLTRCFTHQKVDPTTFQHRVIARYGKDAKFKLPDGQRHRALDDALAVLDELRYYETTYFQPWGAKAFAALIPN